MQQSDAGQELPKNLTDINEQDRQRVRGTYQRLQPYVLALFVVASIAAGYQTNLLHENEYETIRIAKIRIQQRTRDAANRLSAYLSQIPPVVERLSVDAGKLDNHTSIKPALERAIRQNNDLFEVGIAVETEPGEDPQSPHYGMLDNKLAHFELTYDYTQKDWYRRALQDHSGWFEPYFGQTTRTLVIGYTVPFQRRNGKRGIARANLSLHGIRKHLNDLDLGENGFSIIVSKDQRFIYHPLHRYAHNNWTLAEAQSHSSAEDAEFYGQLKKLLDESPDGIAKLIDPITQKSSWVAHAPIAESGWTYISTNIEDELVENTLDQSHVFKVRTLVLVTVAILALWLYVGMRVYCSRHIMTAWPTSLACSITLVIALIVMGSYFNTVERGRRLETITNIQQLKELTAKNHLHRRVDNKEPIDIPTGLFIQSIEFQSSNNVLITGYVWQRVPTGKITPGIIFPEAISGSELKQVYSSRIDDDTLTGWYFETEFRQPFDYSRYPLDNKNVWIRLWHGHFAENVILVPDLSSYDTLAAELTPGIESTIVLSGWNLKASGFQYVKHSYNSSFGFPMSPQHGNVPELYYTVKLERNFIDAFVTNLVPLIVVSIMLFAILLTITHDKDRAGLFGADAFSVVTTTAGLFFIVLVAHIQLRKEFTLPHIIYLEYFYLVMYIAILWVSVAAFLVSSAKQGQLMHYRDGLFAKIFYWPMILIALMLISYNVFI